MRFAIALILGPFFACNNPSPSEEKGDPLSGSFVIETDPSFFPMATVLSETYEGLYPLVNIRIDTIGKGNPYQRLMNKEVRMVLTAMKLNANDSIALTQRGVFPKVSHFYNDALVFISKRSSDSLSRASFTMRHESCFEFNGVRKPLVMRTDRAESENNRYIKELIGDSCMSGYEFTSTPNQVIDQTAIDENQVGAVSWNYLCERKSKRVKDIMTKVSVIPFQDSLSNLVFPSQSTIVAGEYPLIRPVYMITSEPYAGPATGFAAWVASSEGQRVIRLFGAAPVRVPPREIQIEN
ncbi:MAG: PstS family phosphate ABC transporter substrate-binding protein [Bacteroidota bacterium]